MRLLLDTHALLWALTDPSRLSERIRSALSERRNQLLVSPASAWEIATKHRIGKLPQAGELLLTLPRHLAGLGAIEVPVGITHALLAGSLRWANRDPFDRMLAAQAMLESAALVTADAAFSELPGVTVYW